MGRKEAGVVALAVMIALVVVPVDTPRALADDGSVETVGGAVRLMKTRSGIRMLSEIVKAHITNDSVHVDCVFVMKNEGSADTVLIGFPDGPMGPYMGGGEEEEIQSFRSWVDGHEVACDRVPAASADGPPSEVGSWWVKRVAFPRGSVRTLRNRYSVAPGWSPTLSESSDVIGHRSFRYILWTGASWSGTIGSAQIEATVDGITLDRVAWTDPEATRTGRTFRWKFLDFEPGSDGSPGRVELGWSVSDPDKTSQPGD